MLCARWNTGYAKLIAAHRLWGLFNVIGPTEVKQSFTVAREEEQEKWQEELGIDCFTLLPLHC